MDTHKKKGGAPAARNQAEHLNPTALRWRAIAAVGRAALWGLLPLWLADRLIRRMRRSA
jgi:hypothetical protein